MYVKPFYKHLFEGKGKTARKTLFVDVSEVQQVIFFYVLHGVVDFPLYLWWNYLPVTDIHSL